MTTKRNPTTNCRRCHALLRSARSVARGYGDRCWTLRRQEDAALSAGFKLAAIDKARQLIADRAIVRLRANVFQVVSSNGVDRYLTAPETCNCPAGLKARHACYHRAAATMLAA
jgi:Family of unknown function (DUF6011)